MMHHNNILFMNLFYGRHSVSAFIAPELLFLFLPDRPKGCGLVYRSPRLSAADVCLLSSPTSPWS
jgi:hypothetical protein